jgi:hypothetical protein
MNKEGNLETRNFPSYLTILGLNPLNRIGSLLVWNKMASYDTNEKFKSFLILG